MHLCKRGQSLDYYPASEFQPQRDHSQLIPLSALDHQHKRTTGSRQVPHQMGTFCIRTSLGCSCIKENSRAVSHSNFDVS